MANVLRLRRKEHDAAREMHNAISRHVMERCPDSRQTADTYDALSLLFPRNGIKLNIRRFYSFHTHAFINVLFFENLSHALCLLPTSPYYQTYYDLGRGIRLIPFLSRSNDPFGYLANAKLVFVDRRHITKKIECQFESPSKNFARENLLSVCFSVQASEMEFILELIQAIHDLHPNGHDMI